MHIRVYGHELDVTPMAYAYLHGWDAVLPELGIDIRVRDEQTGRFLKHPEPDKPVKVLED